jgi:glucosyl-dolichyl phosphate glucuronosyltransferase
MTVQISAVVATRNRARSLSRAIHSLVAQNLDPEHYEIIVVDNGSGDETAQVAAELSRVPNLRYLYEPVPGVSRARNLGWREAHGRIIAFMDDDAEASPDWLARYLTAFETHGKGIGSIGGRVELVWEAPKPDWLMEEKLGILSLYRYSGRPILLAADQWLSICNLAYPRRILEEAGGLREDLGRRGNLLLSSEEYELKRSLDRRGLPSMYFPEIVVKHHISPSRLTKNWFRRHAYWHGYSEALMDFPEASRQRALRVKGSLQKVSWALPRLAVGLFTLDPKLRFKREYQVIQSLGFLHGVWRKDGDRILSEKEIQPLLGKR